MVGGTGCRFVCPYHLMASACVPQRCMCVCGEGGCMCGEGGVFVLGCERDSHTLRNKAKWAKRRASGQHSPGHLTKEYTSAAPTTNDDRSDEKMDSILAFETNSLSKQT
jgi:hypothetical protein